LQYSRNRYYDYHTGRWLTRDPIGYNDGTNLYQYVRSNPVIYTDSKGLLQEIAPVGAYNPEYYDDIPEWDCRYTNECEDDPHGGSDPIPDEMPPFDNEYDSCEGSCVEGEKAYEVLNYEVSSGYQPGKGSIVKMSEYLNYGFMVCCRAAPYNPMTQINKKIVGNIDERFKELMDEIREGLGWQSWIHIQKLKCKKGWIRGWHWVNDGDVIYHPCIPPHQNDDYPKIERFGDYWDAIKAFSGCLGTFTRDFDFGEGGDCFYGLY
ncbi:RHS repeat-associated core domain-containing protein, partial [Planctomycetota bacterium]